MATKKDLVEAYSFSRRRLVTAFVSGAPGGREVEPARPGRAVVGGIALAVLLLAGAAILGVFKPRSDPDWSQPGLYTDDHGALYVNLGEDDVKPDEESLHQVINVTSARLILGNDASVQKIASDKLEGRGKGAPLGILNAPATVPDKDQLIESGWTACTGTGHGIRVDIESDPQVTSADGTGFLVHDKDGDHLITSVSDGDRTTTYSYDMPGSAGDLTARLHLGAKQDVSPSWTALFPKGTPLDKGGLGLPGYGSRATGSVKGYFVKPPRIGDWFTQGGQYFVVAKGGIEPASDFAYQVLVDTPFPGGGRPAQVRPTSTTWTPKGQVGGADWPQHPPAASGLTGDDQVCGALHDNGDGTSSILMAADPQGHASAVDDEDPKAIDPYVTAGQGAVVGSAAQDPAADPAKTGKPVDTSATTYLIDDRGIYYRIPDEDDVASLGFDGIDTVVPPSWVGLFRHGVELSRDRALCPPGTTGGKGDKCA